MNLRHYERNKWDGLDTPPADADGYCRFVSRVKGLRAAVVNMKGYEDRHGVRTLGELIEKWAPHNENDVAAYEAHVVRRSGFSADEPFRPRVYEFTRPVVEAMIWHENGVQPMSSAEIDQALALAGVLPAKPKSLARDGATQGAGVAGAVGAATAAAGALAEAAPAMTVVERIFDLFYKNFGVALFVLGVAVAAGCLWVWWQRRKARRLGGA